MRQDDFVLRGAPVGEIPDCSLAEYLVPKIRSLPQDKTIQVEAETGAVQTVGELLAMSIRLSEGLRSLGLQEDDVVGMMCRNRLEASEIVLGTWLSGAAIAPMPGSLTVAEMKHALEISKPKFVFCEEEALSNATAALNLLSIPATVILVEGDENSHGSHLTFPEVLAEADVVGNYEPRPVKCPSSQLVGILASSGTSGLPKGVGITHKSLIFQSLTMKFTLAFSPDYYKFLQISQFFWVTGILTFLNSLVTGMVRILMKDPTVSAVLKAIDRYEIENTLMAPLFALNICTSPEFQKHDVSSMKMCVVGGSPFTPSVGQKLKEHWGEVLFIQCYGTTEVCGAISCVGLDGDRYSVGRVCAGVEVKVVDVATGEALKSSRTGEILVRSAGMMKGYVGNEEATREAVDENGWFHTGDLGYYDDSGQLYLVDRIKEMIKIMNMQVSPSEVENVVLLLPGVVEVCVGGVTQDENVRELAAVVVKEKNSLITAEDIQAHVASSLSEYKKLSGGVYFVDSLPKTDSGKISRRKVEKLVQDLKLRH